ncbi:MAG: hypothetical protein WC758_06285 [Candidatus Woesearchaeota archaeon]|jgi:hypothetical protein
MPDLSFNPHDSDFALFNRKIAFFELEKEDLFHLKNLYKMIQEWLALNEFYSVDSYDVMDPKTRDNNIETLYLQKILQAGNSEHHIWWRVHRIPRDNKYYKYYMRVDFQTLNMNSKEITIRGQKIKSNFGDIIIRCECYLSLDYKKEWRNHPFLKHVQRLFWQYIYKKQIDYLKMDVWVTTYKLQDTIKQYLNMKTPYDMPRSFHPEGGV